MRNTLFLLLAIISCYLFKSWLPIPNTISLSNFILVLVLNPVKVFAATIAFIFGFIINGIFIRDRIKMVKRILQKKENAFPELLYIFFLLLTFYFLFKIGFWQTAMFFSFAFLYGMMTIEKKQIDNH